MNESNVQTSDANKPSYLFSPLSNKSIELKSIQFESNCNNNIIELQMQQHNNS